MFCKHKAVGSNPTGGSRKQKKGKKNMNQLQYIPIGQLHHHPKNPRLDLGDLTELCESIKARGVMQNLTVVPRPDQDGYWVVIGNRRMEASKMAGLTELPCVVADMTEKEQASTMVLENMQRSDLTLYEQAHGFQMMMDLGMSEKEISEKTGFSESTVRRRVKLNQFDKDAFQQKCDQGATLMDFVELAKVTDPAVQDKILASKDAQIMRIEIQLAIKRQENERVIRLIEPEIQKYAKKLSPADQWSSKYNSKYYWRIEEAEKTYKAPDDIGEVEYFYFITSYDIKLYVKNTKLAQTEAQAQEAERQAKRKAQLREIKEWAKGAASFRQMFVEQFKATDKQTMALMNMLLEYGLKQKGCSGKLLEYHGWREEIFRWLLNMPKNEVQEDESLWAECLEAGIPFARILLAWALSGGIITDGPDKGYYHTYEPKWCEDKNLDLIYELLVRLGYRMSSTDEELKNGTHKCYQVEE